MKRLILITSLIVLSYSSFSQEFEWTLYRSINGVNIYTAPVDCFAKNIPDQKAILIKVENTLTDNVIVEWDQAIWYNDKLVTENVTDGENHISIEINKNSSVQGSCNEPSGSLYIYKDFITYNADTKLTQYELQNIKVSRQ